MVFSQLLIQGLLSSSGDVTMWREFGIFVIGVVYGWWLSKHWE